MLDNIDYQHIDGRLTPTSISASVIEYGKRRQFSGFAGYYREEEDGVATDSG